MIDFIIALGAFLIGLVVSIIILSILYLIAGCLLVKVYDFIKDHGLGKILAVISIIGIPVCYVYQLILIQLTHI